jgi:hypothetical protein
MLAFCSVRVDVALKMLKSFCHKQFSKLDSRLRLTAIAALLLFPSLILAASFTATLDRDTVNVGEAVTLSLNFEGGSPKAVPALPNIPNLKLGSTAQSSSFKFINGQMNSTVTYTYQLTPTQPGEFMIPALKAEIEAQTFTSAPLKLKVAKNNSSPITATNADKEMVLLRIVSPKKEMFVGEVMPLQLELYVRSGIGAEQVQPQVRGEGLTAGNPVKGSERDVQIGNSVFRCVQVLIPVTAIKTGKFNLSADCALTLQVPSNSRGRDPFDPFGVFGRTELKPTIVSTPQAEAFTILALPKQNVPENFKGAIGNYSLSVSAAPTNVTVGDPITIKVQISGRGQLEPLALPEQTSWTDFKTYPPTSKVETRDQLGLQGTKTFEQVVVPQNPEIARLPSFSFSFFNPDERRYHTLTNAPIPLVVKPSRSLPSLNTNASQKDEPHAQDIVHIKQRLGTTAAIRAPLITQGWFLATQSIPVLAFLGFVAWRRQNEKLASNPRLRRERHVAQVIRQGSQELRFYAAENHSEEFFATTIRLLQEQLGALLDVPASSITEAVIDEKLRPRAVPEENLLALRELFHVANQARYAPDHKHGELQAMIPKIETTLVQLAKLKVS